MELAAVCFRVCNNTFHDGNFDHLVFVMFGANVERGFFHMCALILIASVWLNPCEIAAMEMTSVIEGWEVPQKEGWLDRRERTPVWADVCEVILRNGKTVKVNAPCGDIASAV